MIFLKTHPSARIEIYLNFSKPFRRLSNFLFCKTLIASSPKFRTRQCFSLIRSVGITHSILSPPTWKHFSSLARITEFKDQCLAFLFNRLFLSSAHSSSHILEPTPISHIPAGSKVHFFHCRDSFRPSLSSFSIQPFRLTFWSHCHTLRLMQPLLIPLVFWFLILRVKCFLCSTVCHSFYHLISPFRETNRL